MSAIVIKKVESKADLRRFIDFHYDLYEGNAYDVPPLFSDELSTLSPKVNAAFDFCSAEYYLAYRDGRLAGRVAAIINRHANERWQRKQVRFGWIDFVDDRDVLAALLDAVEQYGRSEGMTEMVGPLGFTDNDPEGMLTWGFDQLGTMPTIYNYPYYPALMEQMEGFEVDNRYVEFKLFVPKEVPEKYAKISQMIERRYGLYARKVTAHEVIKEGMGQKIFALLNESYKDLYGFSPLTPKQIEQLIGGYLKFLDFNLITIIEDRTQDNKLVGVGITMPSLAHALQKCRRGRLWPFGWWHLLRALKMHKTNIVDLLLVGILPEYRAKGANALLFSDLIPRYVEYGFEWGETNVEIETNAGVQGQWGPLDPVMHKKRSCYKKIIGPREDPSTTKELKVNE